jgi:hypothetical protein
MKAKMIVYTIVLLVLETALQVIYYAIKIRYFNNFHENDNLAKVLADTLYVLGTFKLVFYLPVYLIFYIFTTESNKYRISVYHAELFFFIYICSIFLSPGILHGWIDILLLTVIAFLSSLQTMIFLKPGKYIRKVR